MSLDEVGADDSCRAEAQERRHDVEAPIRTIAHTTLWRAVLASGTV